LGLKAIKQHGGLTVAQGENHSAPLHPDMPASAAASGLVDYVENFQALKVLSDGDEKYLNALSVFYQGGRKSYRHKSPS
jgi:hypothetical protein|tara:strand:+ start:2728 stop:2964 length:237 start_codon:yes stop_codon:yes gene_type:complete